MVYPERVICNTATGWLKVRDMGEAVPGMERGQSDTGPGGVNVGTAGNVGACGNRKVEPAGLEGWCAASR